MKQRPVEPSNEEQLKTIMEQIKAVTGVAPGEDVEQAKIVTPAPDTVTIKDLPQTPTPAPIQQAQIPQEDVQPPVINYTKAGELNPGDVVQVVNSKSNYYGVLFIIGDIKQMSVHGFYLGQHGRREFVTVEISDIKNEKACGIIGEAVVKSKQPCSEDWIKQHGQNY